MSATLRRADADVILDNICGQLNLIKKVKKYNYEGDRNIDGVPLPAGTHELLAHFAID